MSCTFNWSLLSGAFQGHGDTNCSKKLHMLRIPTERDYQLVVRAGLELGITTFNFRLRLIYNIYPLSKFNGENTTGWHHWAIFSHFRSFQMSCFNNPRPFKSDRNKISISVEKKKSLIAATTSEIKLKIIDKPGITYTKKYTFQTLKFASFSSI